jgi:hypothetical protein
MTQTRKGWRSQLKHMHESKLAVLAFLFALAGFLGLPVLWKSPAFTATEKLVLSVVVVAYSLLMLGILFYAIYLAYRQIADAWNGVAV